MSAAARPIDVLDGGVELIPTRHAISTALRAIAKAWRTDVDGHWTQIAHALIRRNRLSGEAMARAVTEDTQGDTLVTCDRTVRKRLGKTSTVLDVIRMCPDILVADDVEERVVVLRREWCEVHRRNVEYRSTVAGVALHQHAIGRLYERERLAHGDIIERLRVDLARLERSVAFAHAAGLMVAGPDGDTRAPGATGIVPLGDGMLVVRSIEVEGKSTSSARIDIVVNGAIRMAGAPHPAVAIPVEGPDGPMVRHRVTLGVTYLSYDHLRPEQRDYLALFEDAMAEADMDAITADVGRIWLPHETPAPMPTARVRDRLHLLLAACVRRGERVPVYATKEWYDDRDGERREAKPAPRPAHHHLNWDIQRFHGG